MQGMFFYHSPCYFIKNITLQIAYYLSSYLVFIVSQILIQIPSYYLECISKFSLSLENRENFGANELLEVPVCILRFTSGYLHIYNCKGYFKYFFLTMLIFHEDNSTDTYT